MRIPTKRKGLPPIPDTQTKRLWTYDGSSPAPPVTPPGNFPFVVPLFDTGTIDELHGPFTSPDNTGHVVLVAKDPDGVTLWAAHVVPQSSTAPTVTVEPYRLAQQDDDGDIYMMFRVYSTSTGAAFNFNIDIHHGDGIGLTTLNMRMRCVSGGNTHFQNIVVKFDGETGEVLWASRTFDINTDDDSGVYWWGGQLRWESNTELHFMCSLSHWGNTATILSATATFMPDTDGGTTQAFTDGETWLVTVNPSTGVVTNVSRTAAAVSGSPNNSWGDALDDNGTYMRLSQPFEKSLSGYVAQVGWTSQTGFATGNVDEMVYKDGGAPSAYPTDIAWDPKTGPNLPVWHHAYCLVKDGVHGAPRWVLEPSFELGSNSNLTMMSFAKPVPSTNDFLLGIWHGSTAAPVAFALRSNSTLQSRTYNAATGFGLPSAPLYGGYVMRIADNGVNPDLPTISWAISLHPHLGGGFEGSRLLGQSVLDSVEGHVLCGVANGNSGGPSAFRIIRDTTMGAGEIYDMQIALEHGAPTFWNIGLCLVDYATGEVLKMISFESGTKVDVTGDIVIKGREYWVPVEWIDEVTFGIEAALGFTGPTVAQRTKETIVNLGHRVSGFVRLDRADLLYKGFVTVHDDASGTTKADSGTIRSGACEVTTDFGFEAALVGQLFTGATPVVVNDAPPTVWSANDDPGTDALLASFSIDPNTGIISGTPTLPEAGAYTFAAKARDSNDDFSRSGGMKLRIFEQAPDHQWNLNELAGTNAAAAHGAIAGTYQANHVKGIVGVEGTALDGPNVAILEGVAINSGITLNTSDCTVASWIEWYGGPSDGECWGGVSSTLYTNSNDLFRLFVSGGVFYSQVYSAGGGLLVQESLSLPAGMSASAWGLAVARITSGTLHVLFAQNGKLAKSVGQAASLTAASRNFVFNNRAHNGDFARNKCDLPRIWTGKAISDDELIDLANYEINTGQPAF